MEVEPKIDPIAERRTAIPLLFRAGTVRVPYSETDHADTGRCANAALDSSLAIDSGKCPETGPAGTGRRDASVSVRLIQGHVISPRSVLSIVFRRVKTQSS